MSEESSELPFDIEAVKAAFKNVKYMNDLTKEGEPFQVMFKSTLERLMKAELEDHLVYHGLRGSRPPHISSHSHLLS